MGLSLSLLVCRLLLWRKVASTDWSNKKNKKVLETLRGNASHYVVDLASLSLVGSFEKLIIAHLLMCVDHCLRNMIGQR